MYALTAFGSTNLPTGAPSVDVGTGPSAAPVIRLPGGGIYDPTGTTEIAPKDSTIIRYACAITGANADAVDDTYQILRALRGKYDTLWRTRGDGVTLQWCKARLLAVTGTRTASHRRHLAIDMTFQMISPAWRSQSANSDVYSGASPLAIPNQRNEGDVTQTILTITFTAVDSAITALTLANADSGHSFSWAGTLAAATSLVINTGAETVLNNGADAYSGFTRPTNKAEWFALIPGDNDLTFTRTGGNNASSVTLAFYDSYA